MSTLYIDRKHTRLALQAGAVVPYINEKRSGTVPLKLINHLVIVGKVELDTSFLQQVANAGVPVSLINGRYLQSCALVSGQPGADVRRRINQYKAVCDQSVCLNVARRLVAGKILSCLRSACWFRARRPDLRKTLFDANHQMLQLLSKAKQAETLETLLGIEGSAARVWFQAVQKLVPDQLEFSSRQRRPPPDPVNAMLSLSYTLLHHKAVGIIQQHGLDPDLGFYHQPTRNRQSLACDLIEPLRPGIDRWVIQCFACRDWRIEDFTIEKNGCRLSKQARGKYFAAFERTSLPLQKSLVRMVRTINKYL